MIRFACPGCSATFSVAPEKGGKAGKCPKCGSQFVIPEAGAVALSPAPSPPPPAPPPAADTIEVAPCPGCGMRLSVAPEDVGADVQCPECDRVFAAKRPGAASKAGKSNGAVDVFGGVSTSRSEDDRPSRRRRRDEDEEEEERPSRRSRARADDEDDRPSRRRRRDEDDDEDEDRPKKKKKKRRREEESKRITAGILAILVGGFGVHKFYLGYTGAGIITIVLTCFGVGGIIALIEGIIYLTKSDDEFIETYQIGQKEWF